MEHLLLAARLRQLQHFLQLLNPEGPRGHRLDRQSCNLTIRPGQPEGGFKGSSCLAWQLRLCKLICLRLNKELIGGLYGWSVSSVEDLALFNHCGEGGVSEHVHEVNPFGGLEHKEVAFFAHLEGSH